MEKCFDNEISRRDLRQTKFGSANLFMLTQRRVKFYGDFTIRKKTKSRDFGKFSSMTQRRAFLLFINRAVRVARNLGGKTIARHTQPAPTEQRERSERMELSITTQPHDQSGAQ